MFQWKDCSVWVYLLFIVQIEALLHSRLPGDITPIIHLSVNAIRYLCQSERSSPLAMPCRLIFCLGHQYVGHISFSNRCGLTRTWEVLLSRKAQCYR